MLDTLLLRYYRQRGDNDPPPTASFGGSASLVCFVFCNYCSVYTIACRFALRSSVTRIPENDP